MTYDMSCNYDLAHDVHLEVRTREGAIDWDDMSSDAVADQFALDLEAALETALGAVLRHMREQYPTFKVRMVADGTEIQDAEAFP